jgi:hypothetical protein
MNNDAESQDDVMGIMNEDELDPEMWQRRHASHMKTC